MDGARLRIERLAFIERPQRGADRQRWLDRLRMVETRGRRQLRKILDAAQAAAPVRPDNTRPRARCSGHALAGQRDIDPETLVGALDLDRADFGDALDDPLRVSAKPGCEILTAKIGGRW